MRIAGAMALTFLLLLSHLGGTNTGYAEVPNFSTQNAQTSLIGRNSVINPATKDTPAQTAKPQYYEIIAEVTAYTDDIESCGKDDGITASGVHVAVGHIAMDDSIPFGTRVHIEGMGEFIVTDRGGSITGNRIDVYMPSKEQAIRFGRQIKKAHIISESHTRQIISAGKRAD